MFRMLTTAFEPSMPPRRVRDQIARVDALMARQDALLARADALSGSNDPPLKLIERLLDDAEALTIRIDAELDRLAKLTSRNR